MVAWDAPEDVLEDDGALRAPTPGEIFDQRMDHIMWFDNDKEGHWKAWFPFLKWTQEDEAPLRWGVTAADLARIVLPLVVLDEDAGPLSFAATQPSPSAWTRWLEAITALDVSPHPTNLGKWLREADRLASGADPSIKAALRLSKADLVATEEVAAATISATPQPVQTVLRAGAKLEWSMLTSEEGRLQTAADLLYYGVVMMNNEDREHGSDWQLALSVLYGAGVTDGTIPPTQANDSGLAASWMVRLLNDSELDPILEAYHGSTGQRTMALRDRIATRPGVRGQAESMGALIIQRMQTVLDHFPMLRLISTSDVAHERMRGKAKAEFLMQAARTVLKGGAPASGSSLSLTLLQQLENALSKTFSTLLADGDFQTKTPLDRLEDIAERVSAQTAAMAPVFSPEGRSGATAGEDLGTKRNGIAKQWQANAALAMASQVYIAVRKDLLACEAAGGADKEHDIIWMCATGDSRERQQRRQSKDLAVVNGNGARFCALLFFYAHQVYEAELVDASLAIVSTYAADYWEGLLARRLVGVLFPFDEDVPTPLLGAACPRLLSALQSKEWHKADVTAAVKYLRALMAGKSDATEDDYATPEAEPFGDPTRFEQQRRYYRMLLGLFGYPDSDNEYGWGNALARAAAFWESYHGAGASVDAKLKKIINTFLKAQFTWMGRHYVTLKSTKDPLAKAPSPELNRNAWTAFIQAEGHLRQALLTAGLSQWLAVYHDHDDGKRPRDDGDPMPDKERSKKSKPLPKGLSVELMANKSGFKIKKADGSVLLVTYNNINAELRRCGVPEAQLNEWCLKDILGRAAFKGISACRAPQGACSRKHGRLPSKQFDLAACKPVAKDARDTSTGKSQEDSADSHGKGGGADTSEVDSAASGAEKSPLKKKKAKVGASTSKKALKAAVAAGAAPGAKAHGTFTTGEQEAMRARIVPSRRRPRVPPPG